MENDGSPINLLVRIFNQVDHMRGDLLTVSENPWDLIRNRFCNCLKNAMPDLS